MIVYLGSLAVLFVAAFWRLDTFSGEIVQEFSLDNFETLHRERRLPRRSSCARSDRGGGDGHRRVLAFPIAFYMAKVAAGGRGRCWWWRC